MSLNHDPDQERGSAFRVCQALLKNVILLNSSVLGCVSFFLGLYIFFDDFAIPCRVLLVDVDDRSRYS